MSTARVVVMAIAITASTFVAVANFRRLGFVRQQATRLGVSEAWIPVLGGLHAAAAVGLLLGLAGVPLIGAAAATGLALYFVGAIVVHLRARNHAIVPATVMLLLAIATVILDLAASRS